MVEIIILIFCIINVCLSAFIIYLLKNKKEIKPQEHTKKKELIQDEIRADSYLGHNITNIIDEDVSKYIIDEEPEYKSPEIDPARKYSEDLNKQQINLFQTFNDFYK